MGYFSGHCPSPALRLGPPGLGVIHPSPPGCSHCCLGRRLRCPAWPLQGDGYAVCRMAPWDWPSTCLGAALDSKVKALF